jgi:hypothetical protein
MHPKMMMALADEVESERQRLQRRLSARPDGCQDSKRLRARAASARRLIAGRSLRPRVS